MVMHQDDKMKAFFKRMKLRRCGGIVDHAVKAWLEDKKGIGPELVRLYSSLLIDLAPIDLSTSLSEQTLRDKYTSCEYRLRAPWFKHEVFGFQSKRLDNSLEQTGFVMVNVEDELGLQYFIGGEEELTKWILHAKEFYWYAIMARKHHSSIERVTGVVSVKNPLCGCSCLCEAFMKLDLLGKEDISKFDFFVDDELLLDEECSTQRQSSSMITNSNS